MLQPELRSCGWQLPDLDESGAQGRIQILLDPVSGLAGCHGRGECARGWVPPGWAGAEPRFSSLDADTGHPTAPVCLWCATREVSSRHRGETGVSDARP